MELPNTETDNNDNVFLLEKNKNKENFKEDKNPLIVAPLQSEKVTIIVKSPTLKDKESLRSKVGEVLESVKENASNVVDKVIKVEEQDINSFKRDTESISQSQQQSIEEFVIPVGPVNLRIKVVILSTFLLCSVLNFSRYFQFTCLFLLNLTEPSGSSRKLFFF